MNVTTVTEDVNMDVKIHMGVIIAIATMDINSIQMARHVQVSLFYCVSV